MVGIETLAVRMERASRARRRVAEFLDAHPREILGLVRPRGRSRYHALAAEVPAARRGLGLHLGVAGGYEAGVRVVERCSLISHLANIGDTRSLILHPASRRTASSATRSVAAGAGDDVVRLSVGLETADDIIADLRGALA